MVDLLGLLLLALAGFVVFLPTRYDASEEPGPSSLRWMPLGGVGVGVLSGTFAIGGGLVTLPFVARPPPHPHRAAATTSATAMMSSMASSLGHTVAGNVVLCAGPHLTALGGAALCCAGGAGAARAVLGLARLGWWQLETLGAEVSSCFASAPASEERWRPFPRLGVAAGAVRSGSRDGDAWPAPDQRPMCLPHRGR